MKIVILIIIGIAGGIIGGMGMGGGTLLIPLLTLFTDIEQHVAQAINLIAFIPMSIVALIIHFKNKLVEFRYALWISIPAVATAVLFSLIAGKVAAKSLSMYFGIFLIILGIYQLFCIIRGGIKEKKFMKKFKDKESNSNEEMKELL